MKKQITILLLIITNFGNLYSQNLSDSLLINFFDKTFFDHFFNANSQKKDFYILKHSIPDNVTTDYENFTLHFIDYSQAYPLIKGKKISTLFWAKSQYISTDTVDIIIGGWSVSYEKCFRIKKVEGKRKLITGNYIFAAWCGGTLGYIPQGRFIYNTELRNWIYITKKEIIDEKVKMNNK